MQIIAVFPHHFFLLNCPLKNRIIPLAAELMATTRAYDLQFDVGFNGTVQFNFVLVLQSNNKYHITSKRSCYFSVFMFY